MEKIKDGFKGQISISLPQSIIDRIKKNPLISSLFLTDIGYFPNAQYHYINRTEGTPEHILIYSIYGKGYITVNQQEFKLKANQFFIIPAGTPHSYQSTFDDPWSIYWLHFTGSQTKHFSQNFNDVKNIQPSGIARIEDRIQLFNEILGNLQMGYSQENLEYSNLCLHQLLASFIYVDQYRAIKTMGTKDVIQKSILHMQDNIDKKMSLNEMAEFVKLSSSHFSKLFTEKTHQSPIDYFIHLKMQLACQLLNLSSIRISEISSKVGYDDPYYFSRIFKKTMGISPRKYRERNTQLKEK